MFEVLNAGNKPPLRCLPNIHDLIARQVVAKCLSFGGVQMQGLDLPDKVDICAAFARKFDISDIFEIHDDVWLQSEQFEIVGHCTALLKTEHGPDPVLDQVRARRRISETRLLKLHRVQLLGGGFFNVGSPR
jgi:hypothetical protein